MYHSYLRLIDSCITQAVPLPDVGSVGSLAGRKEDMEFFYSFMGFVHAGVKFRYLRILVYLLIYDSG